MKLGEKIKQLRSQKGLTVRELASLANLNVATISHIENGKVRPNSITIAKIARILDENFDELIRLTDE